MYRQGDVLLMEVADIPLESVKEEIDQRIVLAYGEVTGHAHAIHDANASVFKAANDNRYLQIVENPVILRHEEHSPIAVPPGNYQVIIQREYTPEEIRNVAD